MTPSKKLHQEIEIHPKQIVRILKEVEASETCRTHGISEPTCCVWKNKYAEMEGSQLRHLKNVEGELNRLKRMYADLALEHHSLKHVFSRKGCHRPLCSKAISNAYTTKSASGRGEWPVNDAAHKQVKHHREIVSMSLRSHQGYITGQGSDSTSGCRVMRPRFRSSSSSIAHLAF